MFDNYAYLDELDKELLKLEQDRTLEVTNRYNQDFLGHKE